MIAKGVVKLIDYIGKFRNRKRELLAVPSYAFGETLI
jgi:hypothetical protein